jgi:hypothetical protein
MTGRGEYNFFCLRKQGEDVVNGDPSESFFSRRDSVVVCKAIRL